jgi:chaperonin cofactor prefoldin
MSDNGTLRDHLEDLTIERNELLRQVEELHTRIAQLTKQLAGLWKVD